LAVPILLGWWSVLLPPTKAHAEPPIVAQVRLAGDQRVDRNLIVSKLNQKAGQPLDKKMVDKDIKSIDQMGFFSSVQARIVYIKGQPVLVYTVRERPEVVEVRIEGMKALSRTDSRVVRAIRMNEGQILDPDEVRDTIEYLKRVYKGEGYINAQVTFVTIPRPNNTVISTFKVTEIPQQ
jgi:outer membrane protein insertion porin family